MPKRVGVIKDYSVVYVLYAFNWRSEKWQVKVHAVSSFKILGSEKLTQTVH